MTNPTTEIDTRDLNWDKDTKTLSGDASDTVGLLTSNMVAVKSHHTGQVKIFELVNERKDAELEVIAFEFEARADTSIKMVLFND